MFIGARPPTRVSTQAEHVKVRSLVGDVVVAVFLESLRVAVAAAAFAAAATAIFPDVKST